MGTYPYPIYSVYGSQSEDEVYMLTKAMIEGYDGYKDNAPGASGLAVKAQAKNWAVPVHKGAVKALKEAGAWSDDQEKHNNALLKRQEVLAAAWTDFNKGSPSADAGEIHRGVDGRAQGGARQGRHDRYVLSGAASGLPSGSPSDPNVWPRPGLRGEGEVRTSPLSSAAAVHPPAAAI